MINLLITQKQDKKDNKKIQFKWLLLNNKKKFRLWRCPKTSF